MKSFDWRNMELRDFFGLVAIGILLFTVIFDFGFCYVHRDYAEKNKEELISVYLDLPRMNHIQNESYEVLKLGSFWFIILVAGYLLILLINNLPITINCIYHYLGGNWIIRIGISQIIVLLPTKVNFHCIFLKERMIVVGILF